MDERREVGGRRERPARRRTAIAKKRVRLGGGEQKEERQKHTQAINPQPMEAMDRPILPF